MGTKVKKKVNGPTTIRLPNDLRQEIEEVARQEETNSSTVVRQVLRKWSNKRKNPDLELEQSEQ